MKIKNPKISSIYKYILKHEHIDSDFWVLGDGHQEIQKILNSFIEKDWEDLKIHILNWNEDRRYVLLESVAFGFDGMFVPYLNDNMVPYAGNFLLDIFCLIDDSEVRHNITYFSFFINNSNTKQIEKLKFMKNWILENGYNTEEYLKSPINPIKNIDEAIKKASL